MKVLENRYFYQQKSHHEIVNVKKDTNKLLANLKD
jgi:hypothetical protein